MPALSLVGTIVVAASVAVPLNVNPTATIGDTAAYMVNVALATQRAAPFMASAGTHMSSESIALRTAGEAVVQVRVPLHPSRRCTRPSRRRPVSRSPWRVSPGTLAKSSARRCTNPVPWPSPVCTSVATDRKLTGGRVQEPVFRQLDRNSVHVSYAFLYGDTFLSARRVTLDLPSDRSRYVTPGARDRRGLVVGPLRSSSIPDPVHTSGVDMRVHTGQRSTRD